MLLLPLLSSASDDEDEGAAGGIASGTRHKGISGRAKAAALDILAGVNACVNLLGLHWDGQMSSLGHPQKGTS